jgi:vitamin B12 transporter
MKREGHNVRQTTFHSNLLRLMRLLAAAAVLTSAAAFAAETEDPLSLGEVVVTATRIPVERENLPDSVTVITGEEMQDQHITSLYEALEGQPSIDVEQNGWLGQFSHIRLRGGTNADTSLLFNGVRVYDPTNPANERGDLWSYLGVDSVERIEIVRGPQSSLYGSNAMAGVVNVITPRGGGPLEASASSEYGRYHTWKGAAQVKGSAGALGYYLGVSGVDTDGLYEDDEFRDTTFDSNLNLRPFREATHMMLSTLKLDLNIRYTYAFVNYTDWDYESFQAFNDPTNEKHENVLISSLRFSGLFTSWWDWNLTLGYNYSRRDFNDPDDGVLGYRPDGSAVPDSYLNDLYRGRTYPAILQTTLYYHDLGSITFGAEYYGEDGEFSTDSVWASKEYDDFLNTGAFYTNLRLWLWDDRVTFNLGGRLDEHEEFGSHGTWKTGAAWKLLWGFRLKGNLGTGFKAPSLYNLYDPAYGNADLEPEESTGGDIGIEHTFWDGRVRWEAVYFNAHYEERFGFDYATWRYTNAGTANVDGLELVAEVAPLSWLKIAANYTYTDGEENDESNLIQVSRHKAGVRAVANWEAFTLGLYYQYVGRRPAYDQKTFAEGYDLIDLTLAYEVNTHLEIYGRAENLFDQRYVPSAGFRGPGLAIFGGLRLKL